MGIGGLDKEFSDIFRRAFASRVFPPDVIEQLGMKHVRGILLYGPPGKWMPSYLLGMREGKAGLFPEERAVFVLSRNWKDVDGKTDRKDVAR